MASATTKRKTGTNAYATLVTIIEMSHKAFLTAGLAAAAAARALFSSFNRNSSSSCLAAIAISVVVLYPLYLGVL